jgi:opacity protein-like surface antigen
MLMNSKLFTVVLVLVLAAGGYAQDLHRFTFHAGAGFSPLVGDISSRLDNGWNFEVGGGYNFTSYFSATVDYMYSGFGVANRVLNEAQVPDGNAHLWSITVNPKVTLRRASRIRPYIAGGVGYYRRTVEFTQPTTVPVTIFDPFFGFVFNTLLPANQVIGDVRRGGVGGSLGGGLEVHLGDTGVKFFSEARYHYADTGSIPTRMIPLTLGFRW